MSQFRRPSSCRRGSCTRSHAHIFLSTSEVLIYDVGIADVEWLNLRVEYVYHLCQRLMIDSAILFLHVLVRSWETAV